MHALITFNNVAFQQNDTWTVRVKLGEEFGMHLENAGEEPLQWTTSKDPVLDVSELDATTVKVTALKKGTSRVLLLNAQDNAVFRLQFDVFDPEEAATFDVPTPVVEPAGQPATGN